MGQLLLYSLHGEIQLFLLLSLPLSQHLQNAIHVIENAIVDSYDVMQCDNMPLRQAQDAVMKWPQNLRDILYNGPLTLCCEEWPGITGLSLMEALMGVFWTSVRLLKQLQSCIPMCFHIHDR
jgi:hypothetical protein